MTEEAAAAAAGQTVEQKAAELQQQLESSIESTESQVASAQDQIDSKQAVIEEIAQQLGYNPNYRGDNAVDPLTFILRSKDISSSQNKKIRSLTNEINALRDGIEVVKQQFAFNHQKEVKRLEATINQLREERDAAIDDGDKRKVRQLDSQIRNLEIEALTPPPVNTQPTAPTKEYIDFIERGNDWYEADPEMKFWADNFAYDHRGIQPERMFKLIEKKAKELFPEKFPAGQAAPLAQVHTETVKAPAAAAVASPTSRGTGKKKSYTANDLSYEEKRVGLDFVSQGIFKNLDEYAARVKAS